MKIGFNLDQIIQEDHKCPIYSVKFNDTSSCYFHYFASGKYFLRLLLLSMTIIIVCFHSWRELCERISSESRVSTQIRASAKVC